MPKFMLGNVRHQLDDKGRMRIPAKYREVLGGTSCILPGRAGCLFIVPEDKLTETMEAVTEHNAFANSEANDISTDITSNAHYLEEDAQGRVRLPAELAKLVGIKKEIVFAGKMTWRTLVRDSKAADGRRQADSFRQGRGRARSRRKTA